jgi:integrin beta 8
MRNEILFAAVGEVIRKELETALKAIPMIPGPPGDRGLPGDPGAPGRDGVDGKSVSVEEVASAIVSIPAFEQLVKGERGDPGETGDPGLDGLGVDLPLHEPGSVYRQGAFVTYAHGKVYKALRDTANKPGTADWERIGTLGFEFKGVKTDEAYEEGDIYVDGGSAFLVTRGRGRLLAGRGKDGAEGKRGEPGAPAPRVVAVKASANSLAFAFDDGSVEEASLEGLGLWSDETLTAKVAALAENARMDAREELKALAMKCVDFAQFQREIAKW